jgi:hypothetical protein
MFAVLAMVLMLSAPPSSIATTAWNCSLEKLEGAFGAFGGGLLAASLP